MAAKSTDEEGPAINGTVKVLDWMKAKGDIPDRCPVGDPGPSSATAHKTEEVLATADLGMMTEIHLRVPDSYFATPSCPA